jgi:hypothetical protein
MLFKALLFLFIQFFVLLCYFKIYLHIILFPYFSSQISSFFKIRLIYLLFIFIHVLSSFYFLFVSLLIFIYVLSLNLFRCLYIFQCLWI